MRLASSLSLALMLAAPALAGVNEFHSSSVDPAAPGDTCHVYNAFSDAGTPDDHTDDFWIAAYGWCGDGEIWSSISYYGEPGERKEIDRRTFRSFTSGFPDARDNPWRTVHHPELDGGTRSGDSVRARIILRELLKRNAPER